MSDNADRLLIAPSILAADFARLADEATRKFGGDSLDELIRNRDGYLAGLS